MTTSTVLSLATVERGLRAAICEAEESVAVALRGQASTVRLGHGPPAVTVGAAVGRLLTTVALVAAVADRKLGWSTTIGECLPGRARPSSLPPDTTLQELLQKGGDPVVVRVVEALTGTAYVAAFASLVTQQRGMVATTCTAVAAGRPAYSADVGDLATAAHAVAAAGGGAARVGGWREPGAHVLQPHGHSVALVGQGAGLVAARVAQMP